MDTDQVSETAGMGTLRAGAAKSDITTTDKRMAVHDSLFAKALVLSDGTTTVVIVAMDAVAIGGICDIPDDFLPKLRNRIENELGMPGRNVLVNASHTHMPGPLLCEASEQLDRTFDAIKRASENMVPVKVGTGCGYEDRIMMNRTLRLKNGKHWTIRHANPCPPEDEIECVGPTDPEIGILRIDHIDGRPFAVLFNYAGHPLAGFAGAPITANYPGYASKVIEESLGNGAIALFLQGAGGDIIEVINKDVNRPRNCEPVGTVLGLSTLKALKGIRTRDAKLSIVSETVELPRRTDVPERLAALEQEQAELLASLRFTMLDFKTFLPLYTKYSLSPDYPSDYGYRYLQEENIGSTELTTMDRVNRENIEKYLSNIRAMERLARIQDDIATMKLHKAENEEAGVPTIPAEVMGIKIGDCVLITAPIEVLTEVGLNVKKASPYEHTFMAAFSNGYMHYGAPSEYYDKGGYEVTECLLGSEWQQIYEKVANEVIRRL